MSNQTFGAKIGRASAVLTTSEVSGTALLLDNVWGGDVVTQFSFTLGMLTNVTLRAYVSMDNSTWFQLADDDGTVWSQIPTADRTGAVIHHCAGWKYFKMSAQGSGTVTNSLLDFTHRFLKVGFQG